jgi:hypothetical protein
VAAITGAVVLVSGSSDCDCAVSNYAAIITLGQPSFHAEAETDSDAYFVGIPVAHTFTMQSTGDDATTVSFVPPEGVAASDITFGSVQPDNPGGPPPFTFSNVVAGTEIDVTYPAPAPPPDYFQSGGLSRVHANFVASTSVFEARTYTCEYNVYGSKDAFEARGARTRQPPNDRAPRSAPITEDYAAWNSELWFFPRQDLDMTTGLCEDLLDLAIDPNAFVAIRYPRLPALGGPGGYQVPFAHSPEVWPRVSLVRYTQPAGELVTVPYQVKPEYIDFAANLLPGDESHGWITVGAEEGLQVSCPQGLNIPSGEWEVYSNALFDFGGDPAVCSGCALEAWACYDGDLQIPQAKTVAQLVAQGVGKRMIEAAGIRCAGPFVNRMADFSSPPEPPITLGGPGFGRFDTAPDDIWFHHEVSNLGSSTATVSLQATSSNGWEWVFYRGSFNDPNPGSPIHGTISVAGNWGTEHVWVRATPPTGWEGQESVTVTATASGFPDDPVVNHDVVLIGEVEAPSGGGIDLPVDTTPVGQVDSDCP